LEINEKQHPKKPKKLEKQEKKKAVVMLRLRNLG
jgi:hypothetical protein